MLQVAKSSHLNASRFTFPLDAAFERLVQWRLMTTQPAFGNRLRHWRLKQGLSQEDFGALLDPKARHSTVCCWENGVRRPSLRFLRQIVAITGIPADLALGIAESRQEGQP